MIIQSLGSHLSALPALSGVSAVSGLSARVRDSSAVTSEAGSCAWWNMACQGGHAVANAGLAAITRSIANGASMLLGEIVKTIDESAQVPLADPTYRHVYVGFLGLAAPLIGVVLLLAVLASALRRDAGTLGRAVVGVGVASLGGALYIVFAQGLVAIDNALSHGIVGVTGYDLADSINQLAAGFARVGGDAGEFAANMLIILLMLIMLIAGLLLWFVLILRKIAILVVVAFAPLLIAGYLWAPTRSWVRRLTEVLVALVFTKSAIYALFGIGLALLSRGSQQSVSDLVGTTVLMCGACFAPLMMLRLVHFAAETQLATDAMGTLRGGVRPITNRLPTPSLGAGMGRHDLASQLGQAPSPTDATGPTRATTINPNDGARPTAATGATGSAATAGAGAATAGAVLIADRTRAAAAGAVHAGAHTAERLPGLAPPPSPPGPPDPADRAVSGPAPTLNPKGPDA